MTNGLCEVSSSDSTTLVVGKSHEKKVAIEGNAMKFKKISKEKRLPSFIMRWQKY